MKRLRSSPHKREELEAKLGGELEPPMSPELKKYIGLVQSWDKGLTSRLPKNGT